MTEIHENITTILGTKAFLSASLTIGLSTVPHFQTSTTSNVDYRDQLQRWLSIVINVSNFDSKAGGIHKSAAQLV